MTDTGDTRQPHPIARALERYGLKLTNADLREIALECATGRGRLSYLRDGAEKHAMIYHNKAIVVIYKPNLGPSNLASPHKGAGTVITVLPREAALAGNDHSPATRFKRFIAGNNKSPKSRRIRKGF
jgi:hypothetical protein